MYFEQPNPPKTYRQGRLDALWGLYVCINAQRKLLASNHSVIRLPWRHLFNECLSHLSESSDLATIVADGLSPQQVWQATKYLKNQLLSQYRICTLLGRPLIKSEIKTPYMIFKAVTKKLERPVYEAMICLQGLGVNHWTVVSKIADNYIYPFDSGGTKPIRCDSLVYGKPKEYEMTDYFLPSGLILLKAVT